MTDRLLLCTDLDRTLIPNGPESESSMARRHFSALVSRPEVQLAYVSGRHKSLVQDAIRIYDLPTPDFVIGDVGTTIYQLSDNNHWQKLTQWDQHIAQDWGQFSHEDIKTLLADIDLLRPQEFHKQNDYKLSYYLPLKIDQTALEQEIRTRFTKARIQASLIWSLDEPAGVGLLDILPASASKLHAIEALMKMQGYTQDNTVFSGDSGNDIEVLASPIASILVANSQPEVKELALTLAKSHDCLPQLYIAKGDFEGMNGNYSAGIIEGVVHYFPQVSDWLFNTVSEGK